MPGYLAALNFESIKYKSIPTYFFERKGGKWLVFLKAIPIIIKCIKLEHKKLNIVIVYSHAGKGVSLLREALVLGMAHFFGAKTIMQLHSISIKKYLVSNYKSKLLKLAISQADRLCVLTPWWKKYLESKDIKQNISIVPNPLPPEWEHKARNIKRQYIADSELTVLCMARIEPGKGVDLVVEAIPFLPETVKVIVAGDGSHLKMLEQRSAELCVANKIIFTGWVSGNEKQQLIDEADIFCLPSSYDSFGMGFIEAMANGLPVVALDWGPISDVVVHRRSGYLIKEPNPEHLAMALGKLMDPANRAQMGKEAQKWVLEQFSSQAVGEKLRNMLASVSQ
jgi:glycosyltransferase involved in cell wall biosynthesis